MSNDNLHPTRRELAGALLLLAVFGSIGGARAGQSEAQPASVVKGQAGMAAAAASAAAGASAPAAKSQTAERTPKTAMPKQAPVVTNRRDPFKLPQPPGKEAIDTVESIKSPLPPGTRGLIIGQLRLEGIVRQEASNTMIAVVANSTNRAYFLRENDTLFNGVVSKITPDSVYFRENFIDQYGRAGTREVVKRLTSGTGEGR
jgi:hypothetical protein